MGSTKWCGLVVCAILGMACGAENGAADVEGGAGAGHSELGPEPTSTAVEALDADGDHPVVVTSSDYATNGGYLAAIDTDGRLREQLFSESYDDQNGWVVSWGSWSTIDGGLTGVPTMHVFPDSSAVDVYARGTDGKLWEYFRYNYGGDIVQFDVSTWSGFGMIADSPVIVDWGDDSSLWQISVAVTSATDGKLYTLDYDNSMGWSAHPVLNGSTAIQTTHTIQSPNYSQIYDPNRCPDCGYPRPYFAGRGLSGSDTSTSWVVSRPHGQFGSSFTKLVDFTGASSSPYVWGDDSIANQEFVYARFGSQLKWAVATQGPLSWHAASNCSVAGSPGYNGIRGTNGHLLKFTGHLFDGTFACTDIGEGLTSSPYSWEFTSNFIFFRGNSGGLWAKSIEDGSSEYGAHWNLGIAIP
jgi:hypothetical protein